MIRLLSITSIVALLATSCGAGSDPADGSITPSESPPPSEPVVPAEPAPTSSTEPSLTLITQPPEKSLPSSTVPSIPNPPDDPVEYAIADLAARRGQSAAVISVVSVAEVTWRDGSAGCPREGMNYTQALVNGMQIILETGGETFHYHSAGTGTPFLCENPQSPLPPEAGGYGDT